MKINDFDLFKFTSYDVAEAILCGQLLRFNSPKFFNDPFDCDIDLLEFDFNNISNEVSEDLVKLRLSFGTKPSEELIREAFIEAQKDKINRSSICCFSMDYKSTTMWSHYADRHNGVCLVFDYSINNPFIYINPNQISSFPVDYDNYSKFNYLSSKTGGIKKLFGTKSKDWEYESEYRIVLLENQGFIRFHKEFLSGLIFGMRVRKNSRDRLINISKKFGYKDLKYGQIKKKGLQMKLESIQAN